MQLFKIFLLENPESFVYFDYFHCMFKYVISEIKNYFKCKYILSFDQLISSLASRFLLVLVYHLITAYFTRIRLGCVRRDWDAQLKGSACHWPACVDFRRAFLMSSSILLLSLISSCWVFNSRSFCRSERALRAL